MRFRCRDERRFDVLKERFVRSLKNFHQDQPYRQALYSSSLILTHPGWSVEPLLAAGAVLPPAR
ncbi:MAG: hypothetical protein GY820_48585, partial [Gammaproteobacteria bacterium]|nr:hypothetical protein [Gammaproteobacteria bacterium]